MTSGVVAERVTLPSLRQMADIVSLFARRFSEAVTGQAATARALWSDILRRQRMAAAAMCLELSSLGARVRHVVGVRAEKQMRGINAARIVTAMKNKQTGWNGAVMQFPRVAMCASVPIDLPTNHDVPIAVLVFRADPFPAVRLAALSDACPEPLHHRNQSSHQLVMLPEA